MSLQLRIYWTAIKGTGIIIDLKIRTKMIGAITAMPAEEDRRR